MKTRTKYIRLISIALAAMTAASCSDTWDEHYGVVDSPVTNKTIWDVIKDDSQLSNFVELAEKAIYYRDENKPQKNYTVKDLLNGDQIVTAFIPTNDAYTQEQWDEWKKIQEEYPYTLHQQLMANTITLWRQSTIGNQVDTVTMINGKKIVFDKAAHTIGGSPLDIDKSNVSAKNGIVHTITSPVPFAYNLYEYLKDGANAEKENMLIFHDFLVENDTTLFDENSSIEGNPDENGNPTYVDSVVFVMNQLMYSRKRFPGTINTDQYLTYDEGFGAPINAEDSAYVMLMPTDNAYRKAFEKLQGYYKYADAYIDSEKGDQNNAGLLREVSNPDSLTKKSFHMDFFTPIVYNVNLQPNAYGRLGRWTPESFLQNCAEATYFINTYGDTLRSDDTWQKENLFQGNKVKLSNGYGIVADTWNLPAKLYKPDINIEVGAGTIYNRGNFTVKNSYNIIGFSNAVASAWVDTTGHVSHDDYLALRPNSSNNALSVEFKLVGNDQELSEAEVMSGKYDIYVVCVPSYYATSADTILVPDGIYEKTRFGATVNYNDGNAKTSKKDATFSTKEYLVYEGEKVDTILLFEDFEFPYSYKNLIHNYPTLTISTRTVSSSDRRKGFRTSINIDRIILKSKD